MIQVTREMKYVDTTVAKGARANILTWRYYNQLPEGLKKALGRARAMYKKREIEGVFALLKGKWRWVYKEDYNDLVRRR